MELHLPGQQSRLAPMQSTRFKPRTKNTAAPSQARGGGNKFVGVRQRPSGRWVAEIKDTTQKIRMWLGTFESAEDAARAYDEAACLLRGANTRTNFSTRRPSVSSDAGVSDSPIATRIRKLLHHKKLAGEHSNHHRNPSFFPPSAVSDGGSGGGSPTSSTSTTTEYSGSKQGSPSASDHYQEVYRPYFAPEFELGSSVSESSSSSWAFDLMFEGFELSKSVDFPDLTAASSAGGSNATADVTEFERMTVERQISASLYAMNGVQEYFEAVQDLSSSTSTAALLVDPVWDLPPLYHFY